MARSSRRTSSASLSRLADSGLVRVGDVGVHAEVGGLLDRPEHVEGVGHDHDAGPAAVRVAPLQGTLGPGQVLVRCGCAPRSAWPARHPALAGPAGPEPPSVKRSPSRPR